MRRVGTGVSPVPVGVGKVPVRSRHSLARPEADGHLRLGCEGGLWANPGCPSGGGLRREQHQGSHGCEADRHAVPSESALIPRRVPVRPRVIRAPHRRHPSAGAARR